MENISQLKKDLTAIRSASTAWHFLWAREGGDGKPKLRVKRTPFKPAEIAGYRKTGKNKLLVGGRLSKDGDAERLRFACEKHHDDATMQRHVLKTLAAKVSALRDAVFVPASEQELRGGAVEIDREQIAKMKVGEPIGAGGLGTIHRLGEGLIVKFPQVDEEGADAAMEREIATFERLAARGLENHPNLVRSFGVHTVDGKPGLVLEELTGGSAEDLFEELRRSRPTHQEVSEGVVADGAPLSEDEFWGTVQTVLRGILEGLLALESAGLQHHDLKGLNVMLDADGTPKLIDLGSAVATNSAVDRNVLSTPSLRTPQVAASVPGARIDEARDTWAVGVMLYQLVEGIWNTNNRGTNAISAARRYIAEGTGPLEATDGPLGKGQYAAGKENAYVRLLKRLLHPDQTQRMNAAEALKDPFFTDPAISEEEAQAVIARLRDAREARKAAEVEPTTLLAARKDILGRASRLQKDADKLVKAAKGAQDRAAKKGGSIPPDVKDRIRTLLAESEDLEALLAEDDGRLAFGLDAVAEEEDEALRTRATAAFTEMRAKIEEALGAAREAARVANFALGREANDARARAEVRAQRNAQVAPPPPPGADAPDPATADVAEAEAAVLEIVRGLLPEVDGWEERSKKLQGYALALEKATGKILRLHLAGKARPSELWAETGMLTTRIPQTEAAVRTDLQTLTAALARVDATPGWESDPARVLAAVTGDPDAAAAFKAELAIGKLRKLQGRIEGALVQSATAMATYQDMRSMAPR